MATIDQTYANYNDSVGDTTAVGSYYLDTPLTNPPGPASGQYRVLRGGSWHDQAETVSTSSRGWNQLEYFENVDFGFRCADGTP